MIRRAMVALLMAGLLVPVGATPSWACTCAMSGTPQEHRESQAKSADLIFTGVAKKKRIVDESPNDGYSGDETVYVRFRVNRKYKGHPGRFVTINTDVTGSTCRYNFKEGERYSVFAYKHKGEFHTNICTGTKKGDINPDRYGLD